MLSCKAAVLVAQHEHVQAGCGRVVHEVVSWVCLVCGRAHQEGCACAQRYHGVRRSERKCQNRRRVVAGECDNAGVLLESKTVDEVVADISEVLATVFVNGTELLLQVCCTVFATGSERQQIIVPIALANVPEVHAGDIADVDRSHLAQEY